MRTIVFVQGTDTHKQSCDSSLKLVAGAIIGHDGFRSDRSPSSTLLHSSGV